MRRRLMQRKDGHQTPVGPGQEECRRAMELIDLCVRGARHSETVIDACASDVVSRFLGMIDDQISYSDEIPVPVPLGKRRAPASV
jgi:hypothetical protein